MITEIKKQPKIFKELFMPNWNIEEAKRFTPRYKEELRKRLYRGEEVSPNDLG